MLFAFSPVSLSFEKFRNSGYKRHRGFRIPVFENKRQKKLATSLTFLPFISLNSVPASKLAGMRIGMYSYGSGLASAMYSLRVSVDTSPSSSLNVLLSSVQDIPARLASRLEVSPEDFVKTLEHRENAYHSSSYTPCCPIEKLFPGTYYLENIDKMHRRSYLRIPKENC